MPLPLRWIDARTVEVGLRTDARFTPPLESIERVGYSIRFLYRVMLPDEAAGDACLEPPEGPPSLQLLSGSMNDPTNTSRWLTYGSEQTCILHGSSVSGEPGGVTIGTRFSRTATARLPYGTRELVLTVLAGPQLPETLELYVEPSDEPLQPSQRGGREFLVMGEQAERVLEHLVDNGRVAVSFVDERLGAQRIVLARENFVEAHAAFELCQQALAR